jgi:ankyrin repeat protein
MPRRLNRSIKRKLSKKGLKTKKSGSRKKTFKKSLKRKRKNNTKKKKNLSGGSFTETLTRFRDKVSDLLLKSSEEKQKLLEYVTDINVNFNLKDPSFTNKDDHHDLKPLHYAVLLNSEHAVKTLIEGKNADVNTTYTPDPPTSAQEFRGYTPLHFAAKNGNKDVAQLLIDKEADINAKSNINETPLHVAAKYGNSGVAKLLIDKDANVNTVEATFTPLHYAAEKGYSDIAKLLIDNDANINAVDINDNYTPLHLAAENGNKDVVELLINNDDNINITNKYGQTPLHLAIPKNWEKYKVFENKKIIIEKLKEKNANLTAKTKSNETPLYKAKQELNIINTELSNDESPKNVAGYINKKEVLKNIIILLNNE